MADLTSRNLHIRSIEISNDCPSATVLPLALGPDLPREDNTAPGNLSLSAEMILTSLFATYTGILTSCSSTLPHDKAST